MTKNTEKRRASGKPPGSPNSKKPKTEAKKAQGEANSKGKKATGKTAAAQKEELMKECMILQKQSSEDDERIKTLMKTLAISEARKKLDEILGESDAVEVSCPVKALGGPGQASFRMANLMTTLNEIVASPGEIAAIVSDIFGRCIDYKVEGQESGREEGKTGEATEKGGG
ncbi:hypothetical protein EJ03DRAFT_101776 [Teratosphaeria nubilosa]|uniref:Uncharacterized protein n=1 Tax=Teratosphaeria nubilosa TaxID=161662 RepID=A0A6G1LKW3_9PEZI|nr:hypothetical protein EJ03DRAFT_101776 [Teratosphaeria nubilosa]